MVLAERSARPCRPENSSPVVQRDPLPVQLGLAEVPAAGVVETRAGAVRRQRRTAAATAHRLPSGAGEPPRRSSGHCGRGGNAGRQRYRGHRTVLHRFSSPPRGCDCGRRVADRKLPPPEAAAPAPPAACRQSTGDSRTGRGAGDSGPSASAGWNAGRDAGRPPRMWSVSSISYTDPCPSDWALWLPVGWATNSAPRSRRHLHARPLPSLPRADGVAG